MLFAKYSVNQMFPSGPAATPLGPLFGLLGVGYSLITPVGVIEPKALLAAVCWSSTNQSFPSVPAAMSMGWLSGLEMGYSVATPDVVIRPTLPTPYSVNHRLPSGPETIPRGSRFAVVIGNSVTVPFGVIRPIWFWLNSVNQRFPSGPGLINARPALPVVAGYSVTVPTGAAIAGEEVTRIARPADAMAVALRASRGERERGIMPPASPQPASPNPHART